MTCLLLHSSSPGTYRFFSPCRVLVRVLVRHCWGMGDRGGSGRGGVGNIRVFSAFFRASFLDVARYCDRSSDFWFFWRCFLAWIFVEFGVYAEGYCWRFLFSHLVPHDFFLRLFFAHRNASDPCMLICILELYWISSKSFLVSYLVFFLNNIRSCFLPRGTIWVAVF